MTGRKKSGLERKTDCLPFYVGKPVASKLGQIVIDWFSNRTGTSVDDGARKSNNWLDQWQSGKLGTGSRV